MRLLKWLYPGMKVKRWIFSCAVGICFVGLGSVMLLSGKGIFIALGGLLLLSAGISLVILGISQMVRSITTIFLPHREKELVDIVYKKRYLARGPKIVVVGGGTGLSVLLQGIKEYTSNITAVVTVADEGGSSGRLREQFDMLPPGDIRNCLVALADAEPLMRQLFQFRFDQDSDLRGHNFGNLFLTAMSKVTGDFEKAVKESSKILAIRGNVVPSTLEKVRLIAQHIDGTQTLGETKIPQSYSPIKKVALLPERPKPCPDAIESIAQADAIIIGPGSLYTSIIPNLLVDGIPAAIERSKAIKVYICNVMTQKGETDNYTASDHIKAIIFHSMPAIIDCCIVNTGHVPADILARYKEEQAAPVIVDAQHMRELGCAVIEDDVISVENYVRHNPEKLSRILIDLIWSHRNP